MSVTSKVIIIAAVILSTIVILVTPRQPKIDITAETEALLAADRAFSATSAKIGAAKAFKQFLADDAIQFPSKGKPLHGSQAIYDQMIEGDDAYTLTWEPKYAEVSACADLGWTWGRWTLVPVDTTKGTAQGHYLNVWKKIDGKWRVLADGGSND